MNKLIFLISFFTLVIAFQSKAQLPEFTPFMEIDNITFTYTASRDALVGISEIANHPSTGPLVVKIPKMTAFDIVFDPAMTMANLYGGTPVNNSIWTKTEDSFFITFTMNAGVVASAYSISSIGLTITRKPGAMSQTNQSFTVTIVNGTGGDSDVQNNAYNVVLKAQ